MCRMTGTDSTFSRFLQFSVRILHPTEMWGREKGKLREEWLITRRSRLILRILHSCGTETCLLPPAVPQTAAARLDFEELGWCFLVGLFFSLGQTLRKINKVVNP